MVVLYLAMCCFPYSSDKVFCRITESYLQIFGHLSCSALLPLVLWRYLAALIALDSQIHLFSSGFVLGSALFFLPWAICHRAHVISFPFLRVCIMFPVSQGLLPDIQCIEKLLFHIFCTALSFFARRVHFPSLLFYLD